MIQFSEMMITGRDSLGAGFTASARAIREIVLRATVMIFSEPLITTFTIVSNNLE